MSNMYCSIGALASATEFTGQKKRVVVQKKLHALLKIILSNSWTLQLFTINIINLFGNIFTKDNQESPGLINLGLVGRENLKLVKIRVEICDKYHSQYWLKQSLKVPYQEKLHKCIITYIYKCMLVKCTKTFQLTSCKSLRIFWLKSNENLRLLQISGKHVMNFITKCIIKFCSSSIPSLWYNTCPK